MTNSNVREKIQTLEGEIEVLKRLVVREPDFEIDKKNWKKITPEVKKIRKKLYKKTYGKKQGVFRHQHSNLRPPFLYRRIFYILTRLKDRFVLQINHYALNETLEVLDQKFSGRGDLKNTLFLLLGVGKVQILNNPQLLQLKSFPKIVDEDDLPILASAILKSDYLITLDKDFLESKVKKFAQLKNTEIVRPQEFITKIVKKIRLQ